jgi:hypothetical protein
VLGNGVVKIQTIDEKDVSFLVNKHRLKVYTKPVSRANFISGISEGEMEVIQGGESLPKSIS